MAAKGVIGLPIDTTKKILKTPLNVLKRKENKNEKSDAKI